MVQTLEYLIFCKTWEMCDWPEVWEVMPLNIYYDSKKKASPWDTHSDHHREQWDELVRRSCKR
jgi:hypothetical protein